VAFSQDESYATNLSISLALGMVIETTCVCTVKNT